MQTEIDLNEITEEIINSSFTVMNELGIGFLEHVYRNSLALLLREKGLKVTREQSFDVKFRDVKVGYYRADLVVEDCVIVELKCCEKLCPEHSAQTINYLAATKLPTALLLNFGNKKIEIKRLYNY